MFKDIVPMPANKYDIYYLIDDDFNEYLDLTGGTDKIISDIIKIYENKKLNVAANIILFFKYWMKTNYYSLEAMLYYASKSISYSNYEDSINKYLLLL
jgi:hypothetical protein